MMKTGNERSGRMKHFLFNWTELSHAPIFAHQALPVNGTTTNPEQIMKSQQFGWSQFIELCRDCFIRY